MVLVLNETSDNLVLKVPFQKENIKTSTESAKEQSEQILPKEEIDKIEAEEAGRVAASNVRIVATGVSVCSVILEDKGIQPKNIYNSNNGCADYDFLIGNEYLLEPLPKPPPSIKTDDANSIICIWSSVDSNNWALYATKQAVILLEDGSSKQVESESVSEIKLSSSPKNCQKL